jgi:molybdopterin synthase catalytic subunit
MANAPPGVDWLAVGEEPLPVAEVFAWALQPGCGAVVTFCGAVRDHSDDRAGVVSLEYEAYLDQVEPRLAAVASAARDRWPAVGRLALLHRIGKLLVGEISVLVTVSAPHRAEAFEAARYGIDAIKASVPIWKRETWAEGSDWALCSHDVVDVDPSPGAPGRRSAAGGAVA